MSGTLQPSTVLDLPLERIADELGRHIYTATEIAEKFSTDLNTLWELLQRPEFYAMVRQRKAMWNASTNTEARMRTLSQIAYAELLPTLYGLVVDPKGSGQVRMDAAKLIQKAAEPGGGGAGGANGSMRAFQVNINFQGGERMSIATQPPQVIEHEDE